MRLDRAHVDEKCIAWRVRALGTPAHVKAVSVLGRHPVARMPANVPTKRHECAHRARLGRLGELGGERCAQLGNVRIHETSQADGRCVWANDSARVPVERGCDSQWRRGWWRGWIVSCARRGRRRRGGTLTDHPISETSIARHELCIHVTMYVRACCAHQHTPPLACRYVQSLSIQTRPDHQPALGRLVRPEGVHPALSCVGHVREGL